MANGNATSSTEAARYNVTGMDCASCAAKIEKAARGVAGVRDVKVSIASQVMTLSVDDPGTRLPAVEAAVTDLGYRLNRVSEASDDDDDDRIPDLSHVTPAYKRALWIVVLLNVGYGIVEAAGSFLAGSQALQADSLDFIGDGLISFLGLMAVGWPRGPRQGRAAPGRVPRPPGSRRDGLYRVPDLRRTPARVPAHGRIRRRRPRGECRRAAVLIPHRKGDANVRAVWLFSRNDAIGNLMVVLAAGLVFWTGTQWPDLVVAFIIAGLFLQSAWSIIRDARSDLRDAKG
ncbi:cation transporter [Neoaquamicrobium sediminum]|uniref:cation transporter n=1 Tax=Neoaquamicrobium sediminum TaxID=1849104 RepID=UPI001FD35FC3|nr:cation transporter [Mesorhizobium sediminum]